MIKKCKKCLYDEDHPFGIVIYSDGICSGCKTHDEKYKIDWKERKNVLKEILKKILFQFLETPKITILLK